MSNLLRHYGFPLSEAMVFGLSSAISFAYLPFVKLGGLPLVAYRMPPKFIIKGLQKPLGLRMRFETFRSAEQGTKRLNELLEQGKVVGLQTSVYWLPYFPPDMRFHFNAHNLLVYEKQGTDYQISDPVVETTVSCPAADLEKARFAKGVLAPKGLLYYPEKLAKPEAVSPQWPTLIRNAIRKTARIMLRTPVPIIGTKGIRMLAKAVRRLEGRDARHSKLFIGHIVRMQEEIGTGGAGFRFIYAAFLQEAAPLAGIPALEQCAAELLEIGDAWREFALLSARMVRDREPLAPARLAEMLETLAERERQFFLRLEQAIK
jgi:Domain of unknown function (DUF4872)/Butirosin biosynthesis protein H, N-terminal